MRSSVVLTSLALALATVYPLRAIGPFADAIPSTNFVVDLEDFAVIPGQPGSARLSHLDTDPAGRIFANDQNGPLYLISADGSSVTQYLNLAATPGVALRSNGEQGFQSFAFHPQFIQPGTPGFGKLYTAHTTSNNGPPADFTPGGGTDAGDHVILEWQTNTPEATTFAPAIASKPFRELLRIEAPFANHTMGLIAFKSNSAPPSVDFCQLYIAVGDGGSGGDPLNLAGDAANPYGSILRINPLGDNSANGRYGIPPQNPFVGDPNALDEIFAFGLRNPQRFAWDSDGKRQMFIADIGQGVIEEINLGVAGANYGWSQREGSFPYPNAQNGNNLRNDATLTGYTYPIAEYDHDEGKAVTVGPVERTGKIPGLFGQLIFGDLSIGRIFILNADDLPSGGQAAISELRVRYKNVERSFQSIINLRNPQASRADLRFGSDASGRVFLFNKQDNVVRVLSPRPSAPPANARPRIRIIGDNRRTTRNKMINVRGRAFDDGRIVRVEINNRRQKRGFHPVDNPNLRGTDIWLDRTRLRRGRNVIRVRAFDVEGNKSLIDRVVVIRR